MLAVAAAQTDPVDALAMWAVELHPRSVAEFPGVAGERLEPDHGIKATPSDSMAAIRPNNQLGTSRRAPAGAAAAFFLRHLSNKVGCPSTPLFERMLHDLTSTSSGATVASLESWFRGATPHLRHLGMRIVARRVAFRTPWLLDWVGKGNGFRGAVLQTDRRLLHDVNDTTGAHAVGLVVDESGRKPAVMMVDPWPGADPVTKPAATLERAHRAAKYGALVVHWTGYS